MPPTKKYKKRAHGAPVKHAAGRKSELVESIHTHSDAHKACYVFDVLNSRTSALKQARQTFKDEGVFVFGKTKVMQIALGRNKEESYKPNLNALGEKLAGAATGGLFFTSEDPKKIEKRFRAVKEMDFARAGFEAQSSVELKAGPIVGLPSSMLEPMRKLKLPVKLNKGVIELETDHVVCSKGDVLTVDQARVLKLFGVKLSEFQIRLLWRWTEGDLIEL